MDLDAAIPEDLGAWQPPGEPAIAMCAGCRQPFWSAEGIERHGDYCSSLPPSDPGRLERVLGRFFAPRRGCGGVFR